MGLAICRSIVEAHDGRLSAENSAAGRRGFPIHSAGAIMIEKAESAISRRETVFIVDDDAVHLRGPANLLESVGMRAESLFVRRGFREQWRQYQSPAACYSMPVCPE